MNDKGTRSDDGLTENERRVLQLLASGKTLTEISSDLGMTEETARNHRKHLMKHLNLYNLPDLSQYAAQAGLISLEERFTKRLDVGLTGKAIFTSRGRPLESRVKAKDLSAHGAYLLSDASPQVGDSVQVHLHQENPKILFEAEGKVTRVDQLSEDECGIAVQFQAIPGLEH